MCPCSCGILRAPEATAACGGATCPNDLLLLQTKVQPDSGTWQPILPKKILEHVNGVLDSTYQTVAETVQRVGDAVRHAVASNGDVTEDRLVEFLRWHVDGLRTASHRFQDSTYASFVRLEDCLQARKAASQKAEEGVNEWMYKTIHRVYVYRWELTKIENALAAGIGDLGEARDLQLLESSIHAQFAKVFEHLDKFRDLSVKARVAVVGIAEATGEDAAKKLQQVQAIMLEASEQSMAGAVALEEIFGGIAGFSLQSSNSFAGTHDVSRSKATSKLHHEWTAGAKEAKQGCDNILNAFHAISWAYDPARVPPAASRQ